MNESAQRVGTDQTKQPEHQQYDKYCPKHNGFLWLNLSLVRDRWLNCAYGGLRFIPAQSEIP
jgi:hypothetical protein